MDFITCFAGVTLVVAPFALPLHGIAAWCVALAGVVTAVLAGYRAITRDQERWEEACVLAAAVIAIGASTIGNVSWPARAIAIGIATLVAALALIQLVRSRSAHEPPPSTT